MNNHVIDIVNPALSALLNGAYQGMLLVCLVWLAVKLFPRANATTRYTVALLALLIVAVLPVAHLVLAISSSPSRAYESEGYEQRVPAPLALPEPDLIAPDLTEATAAKANIPVAESVEPPVVSDETAWRKRLRHFWQSLWLQPQWESILPRWVSLGLFTLWLIMVLGRLTRLLVSYRGLSILKRRATVAPTELAAKFEAIRGALPCRRKARLKLSHKLNSPVAAGFLRPTVLLPCALAQQMDSERFDQVIRHELAHLTRRDDWSNLVQQIIRAIFFFHPGVWWLSRWLDTDREVACDDHVLAVTPRPESYALFLTELASGGPGQPSILASAAWNTKHQIEERINMILNKSRNTSTVTSPFRASALTLVTLLFALAAFQLAPRLALAQEAKVSGNDLVLEAPVVVEVVEAVEAVEPVESRVERSKRRVSPVISVAESGNRSKPATIQIRGKQAMALAQAEAESEATAKSSKEAKAERKSTKETRTGKEGNIEERLARLEKLVASLADRDRSGDKDKDFFRRFETDGGSYSYRSGKATISPDQIAGLPKEKVEGARNSLEGAKRELAARRAALQSQLEEVRRQLERVEKDLRALREKTQERSEDIQNDIQNDNRKDDTKPRQ